MYWEEVKKKLTWHLHVYAGHKVNHMLNKCCFIYIFLRRII